MRVPPNRLAVLVNLFQYWSIWGHLNYNCVSCIKSFICYCWGEFRFHYYIYSYNWFTLALMLISEYSHHTHSLSQSLSLTLSLDISSLYIISQIKPSGTDYLFYRLLCDSITIPYALLPYWYYYYCYLLFCILSIHLSSHIHYIVQSISIASNLIDYLILDK